MKPEALTVEFQKWKIQTSISHNIKEGDYASGNCPICGEYYRSDVRSSTYNTIMRLVASHIIGHIKMQHGELLDPPIEKDECSKQMDELKKQIWGENG